MKIRTNVLFLIAGVWLPFFMVAQTQEVMQLRQDIKIVKTFGLFETKKTSKKTGDLSVGFIYRYRDGQSSVTLDLRLKEELKKENAFVYLFDISGSRKTIFDTIRLGNKIGVKPQAPDNLKRFWEIPASPGVLKLMTPFNSHLLKFNKNAPPLDFKLNSSLLGPERRITLVLNLYFGKENEFYNEYQPINITIIIPEEPKPIEPPVEQIVQPAEPVIPTAMTTGKVIVPGASGSQGASGSLSFTTLELQAFTLLEECKNIFNQLFKFLAIAEGKPLNAALIADVRSKFDERKFKFDQLMGEMKITEFRKIRQLNEFKEYYDAGIAIIEQQKNLPPESATATTQSNQVKDEKKISGRNILKYILIGVGGILLLLAVILLLIKGKKKGGHMFKMNKKPPVHPRPPAPITPQPPRPGNLKV